MLQLITLGAAGLMYLGFGLLFFFQPRVLEKAKIMLSHPTGIMEVRSFYGGLEIGLGLFLLYALINESLRWPALLLTALVLGFILAGRLFGTYVDGIEGNYLYYALAIESPIWLLALASLYGYSK